MGARVKICGLTRLADVEAVNAAKPDYIGFVFAESRRKIAPEQAVKLRAALRPDIIPVGVFADALLEHILALVRGGAVDVIQLHGAADGPESGDYIAELKARTNAPLIKAVALEKPGDAQKWAESRADYLLFDSKGGGTGQVFDWDLIGNIGKPYFLAGGLNAGNIACAVRRTAAYAFDVSGGVETDGLKDPGKIRDFVEIIRRLGVSRRIDKDEQ